MQNLYNADTYTYFECITWQALCKAYAFEPGMVYRGYAIYPHRGYLHGLEAEAAEAAGS